MMRSTRERTKSKQMKKIPTIFERDWNGDRSRVLDKPNPDCGWVFAGQGAATVKLDGTCCLLRDGRLFKRRELRQGETSPVDFEGVEYDAETGKTVGWVPVGPEDRWHREALDNSGLVDGTYELGRRCKATRRMAAPILSSCTVRSGLP